MLENRAYAVVRRNKKLFTNPDDYEPTQEELEQVYRVESDE